MIPLRDINPTRTRPVLTWGLIAINCAVFLYQSVLPQGGAALVQQWGLVPDYLSGGHIGSVSTVLTSMFLHGSWMHLIFNMWSLYIFGDNVEDVLGRPRFAFFYVLSGCAAALTHVAIDADSTVPMVGASGAIAGVLAAYLRLFPHARIVTLIPIFFFFFIRELPAVFFIGLWFVIQLLNGVQSLGLANSSMGGVAFFAHIGGFVAGLYLISRMGPRHLATLDRPPTPDDPNGWGQGRGPGRGRG